jgi:glycosyltransferase involved in cell wall biosynthesis
VRGRREERSQSTRSRGFGRRDQPRILIAITLAEVGGAQTYVASLLPAFAEHFDVTVAAHGPGPLHEAARRADVRFVELRQVRRRLNPWRDLLGFLELFRLLRRARPAILHAHSSKAGVLGRLAAFAARVPIRIFTVHGWAFNAHQGLASAFYRWADRVVARITTVTVCVSEQDRIAGIAAETCRAERTIVIRSGVEVKAAPAALAGGKTPKVVSVGRLQAPKDFGTLARALAKLKAGSFQAVLVGDGPDRPALENELRRLGLSNVVELAGERDDVPELLAGADVFVLSSRSEGLPLSILEAMAVGLPVVASAVGGVPELVVDGTTGLLVRPGDPGELAEALAHVLADAGLRRRLGCAGHERARSLFDLAALRGAYVELYTRELARAGLSVSSP